MASDALRNWALGMKQMYGGGGVAPAPTPAAPVDAGMSIPGAELSSQPLMSVAPPPAPTAAPQPSSPPLAAPAAAPALPPMLLNSETSTTSTSGVRASKASTDLQDKALADEKALTEDRAKLEKERAAAERPIQSEVHAALDDIDTKAEIQRQAIAKQTAEAQTKYANAVDAYSKMKVDPGRYWANKSTGEKFGLTLAAMLGTFGSTLAHGQNTTMDTINRYVDADIAAQRDEIMNAREGVTLKNNLVAELRQKGLSLEQSTLAAKQIKLEQAKRQLDAIRSQNPDPEIDARKKAAQVEIDKHIAEIKVKRDIDAQGKATTTTATQMKSPTAKTQELPAGEATKIGGASAAVKNAQKILETWKSKAGDVGSWLLSKLPATEASRYGDNARAAAQVIGTYLEGGKLTDADYPKYLAMLPQPGDSEKTAKNKVDAIETLIADRQAAEKQALTATGYDVSRIKDAKPKIDFQASP
jgi:hypothetical protein